MKKRILFVDDEPHVLDGLQRMLRPHQSQWQIEFVTSAAGALDALTRTSFDAVVSDITMPGKNGLELLQTIRCTDRTKDIPVIILTGLNEVGLKRRALDMGASDLLNKPVQPEDLVARIRSVLQLKTYQDELKDHNALLERRVQERTAELADSRLDIIWRLGKAAEYRDEETGNHIVRVGCYCRALAEALGMERDFVETLFLASPLHDIGKIGIPDRILLKAGALDAEEWEIMKQHCTIGADILREDSEVTKAFLASRAQDAEPQAASGVNPLLEMASTIALTHHERWDGTGYPAGLEKESIPLESRIVALADVYDALRSDRPYKPARSESGTLEIIGVEFGRHFDPDLYRAFGKSVEEFREIRDEFSDEIRSPVEAGV